MSVEDLRKQMKLIQKNITEWHVYEYEYRLTNTFIRDVNELSQIYGNFLGKAKALNPGHISQIISLDNQVTEYFQLLLTADIKPNVSFSLINLASGKISELISFVSALEAMPAEEKISKKAYDKLNAEKEELKKTIDIMVQYKGLPELNSLMENAKNHSLPLDE